MSQAVRCQEESEIDEPTRERQQERATKDKRCPQTHWHLQEKLCVKSSATALVSTQQWQVSDLHTASLRRLHVSEAPWHQQ